ncbi:MAG: hypothetical protein JEZ07_20195 [Phycisphaerae bacterium]|nr:hypothetical protein [Phycisphaerae bacterium]
MKYVLIFIVMILMAILLSPLFFGEVVDDVLDLDIEDEFVDFDPNELVIVVINNSSRNIEFLSLIAKEKEVEFNDIDIGEKKEYYFDHRGKYVLAIEVRYSDQTHYSRSYDLHCGQKLFMKEMFLSIEDNGIDW